MAYNHRAKLSLELVLSHTHYEIVMKLIKINVVSNPSNKICNFTVLKFLRYRVEIYMM